LVIHSKQRVMQCLFLLTFGILCPDGNAQATEGQVAQTSVPIDKISASIRLMGGSAPKDSLATANVTITAGRTTEIGKMRIVTFGTTQTLEEVDVPSGVKRRVFTQDQLRDNRKNKGNGLSFEDSLSAQSPLFPLPWLSAKATGSDLQIENAGTDKVGNTDCQHLRLSRAWQSDNTLKAYAKFTEADLWLDSNTGLPAKIAFERRSGWGAVPAIPVAVEYSDYRTVDGILYPFHIKQYVNGTLWADIHVQDVRFNAGISASEFSTQ